MSLDGGRLFAVPLHLNEAVQDKHKPLFDHLVAHPVWFTTALDPEAIREVAARGLVRPDVASWEVYDGPAFVGLLLLTDLYPGLSATVHFTFWSSNLFAARKLIVSWLGYVFDAFDLQRVGMEIPEGTKGLISFARQKLGFKYEGEPATTNHRIGLYLESDAAKKAGVLTHEAGVWLAKQGSRRESAHWDPKLKRFRDVYLLRLLRCELTSSVLPAPERATSESENPPDESRRQTSTVSAVHSA